MTEGYDKTPCCGTQPEAVRWDPWSRQVRCQHCGHVWEPVVVRPEIPKPDDEGDPVMEMFGCSTQK